MFIRLSWTFLALGCASAVAQSTLYQLTMSVSDPAPVPGKPFTITWTGGEANEPVYIVLNNYFPDLPDQDIIYGGMDILSNAPNNGSWTYNVPLNIIAGRHSFSIGYNPVMLSDTSDIFTILRSQTSYVAPGSTPIPTGTGAWTYNSCGLPPLPDYTYTGYQPPCTTTVDGKVETLYPLVPASDSSVFYPNLFTTGAATPPTTPSSRPNSPNSINTAFATGVLAQDLQCNYQVTPSTTQIVVASVTTVLYLVGCSTASASMPSATNGGVCHSSGYITFPASGTSSVCCPNGWATTPLANSELYCFTEVSAGVAKRQASTETLNAGVSNTLVEVQGLVFTRAGIVTKKAETETETRRGTGSLSSGEGTTMTSASVNQTSSKSSGDRLGLSIWRIRGITLILLFLCIYYN